MIETVRCADADALVAATLKALNGPNVAISGGSTYASLFPGWAAFGDLQAVSFFPADERCVPIDHPESNWGVARRLLFAPLGRTEDIDNFASSAAQYQALLFAKIGRPVVFDTVFVGMGNDGHTASLFPEGPELADRESQVLETTSPKPPTARVTLGLATLWRARSLVAVVTGTQKRAMVERLLAGDRTLPITVALEGHRAPVLILDREADPTHEPNKT